MEKAARESKWPALTVALLVDSSAAWPFAAAASFFLPPVPTHTYDMVRPAIALPLLTQQHSRGVYLRLLFAQPLLLRAEAYSGREANDPNKLKRRFKSRIIIKLYVAVWASEIQSSVVSPSCTPLVTIAEYRKGNTV